MEQDSWYKEKINLIENHKLNFNKKEIKVYKIDLLIKLINKIDEFSSSCEECEKSKEKIERVINKLETIKNSTKEDKKEYYLDIESIKRHLQSSHNLINEGHYAGTFMCLGLALGVSLGSAFKNSGIGIVLGLNIGLIIGASMDTKAKKEGRDI